MTWRDNMTITRLETDDLFISTFRIALPFGVRFEKIRTTPVVESSAEVIKEMFELIIETKQKIIYSAKDFSLRTENKNV